MTMQGEYVPSPRGWVREQVEKIAESGTTRSVHIMNRPVVLLRFLGTGNVRRAYRQTGRKSQQYGLCHWTQFHD